jgi:hypothetical protein
MANNQNRGNKPAMTLEKITDVVREFVSLYTQQEQTNENRKKLESEYRNKLINQDMKKVNRILAAQINHVKRHENVDADQMRIDFFPDTGSNIAMKNISPNSDAKGYSMIIRNRGGGFLFAKSLMHQRDSKWVPMLFGARSAGQAIIQNARLRIELENAVLLTMRFLVALVEQTIGHQSNLPAQPAAFNGFCRNVTEQIIYYIDAQPTPPANSRHIYKVNIKSVRTNNPVRTAGYFEEVFSTVRTYCGRIEGHPTGRSKCPVLPILLNADFFTFATTVRSPKHNPNLFADFSGIQFPGGGTTFDTHLKQIRQGYQTPESAATRANGDVRRFIEPISKLMNDHLMNLSTLQSSLAGLSTLASVTQKTIDLHFGVQEGGFAPVSTHEVVNRNRVLGYVSQGAENKGTKIMMVSNTFLNQATRGLSLDVGKLFDEFNPRTPNNVHNNARKRSRGIKKTEQAPLVSELRKIDPLLQSLNRLRFGKTTSNNRINANNNNIRMNYNSNTAPARLFVDMVFREILNYKTGRQFDRNEFSMNLQTIYSTFASSRGVNVQKLQTKMNRTYNLNADSNATRAMRNGSNNNQTMRNVNLTKIKQLIVQMRDDFKNLFEINQNGVNLSIRSAISGKFVLGNSKSNGQNEWDYVSWFLSNVELANRSSNPAISKLRSTHKLVVSAVFALIKKYHAQFTRELLKPITGNSNNVSTRLHSLNADQKREAVSMCYSVAHAELFARVEGKNGYRTYGDEGDVNGNTPLTFAGGGLPGYSIPAGLMFDCRLPEYDGQPNGAHAKDPDEDTVRITGPGGHPKRSKDGLPGLMGNDRGNPGGTVNDDHYCNKVNNPAARGNPAYVEHPIGRDSRAFGNYDLLAHAKHGKTIADIKRAGVTYIPGGDYLEITHLSMNPDHILGYKNVPAHGADHADMMTNIMSHTYNKRRDMVVQEFMSNKKTSSAAAYLWYDCGDTHAMRVAVEATSKLVSDLKQLGFANYPISGYVASTSPLFEQSVILRQTGMLCAPIFLETLRRRLGNAPLNQTEYVRYGGAPIKTSSRMERSINYVPANIVNLMGAAQKVTLAEDVLFSPKSIHDMGGIEYRGSTPSFIDSISNRPNNIPNAKSITNNTRDFALSFHNYFLEIYKKLPAYQLLKYRFYLVDDSGAMPYTMDSIDELDSVDSLKRLMSFDYWKLRRSFWVSHLKNLNIIRGDPTNERQTAWNVSTLEDQKAKQSLSLLERVLAYWQMYNHADRKIGANIGGLRRQIGAGILDNNGTSTRFHRGMYGSRGNTLNDRLNMEYSMAVEKSMQMRESFKSKFSWVAQ